MSVPVTPTKKTSHPPLASTPYKKTSGSSHAFYTDVSHESKNDSPRLQADLKRLVRPELQDRVFQSNDLPPESLFHIKQNRTNWRARLDKLDSDFFVKEGKPRARGPIKKLMALGDAEVRSYPLVVTIVNAMCASAPPGEGFFAKYRLGVYDKQMRGTISGASSLKPDFWFCDPSLIFKGVLRDRYFFSDERLGFPGEGKGNDVEDGIVQGATYPRAFQLGGRWYSMYLTYNTRNQSVRFCFVIPSGLYVTPRWALSNRNSFRRVAEVFYALQDMSAFEVGIHPFHSYYHGTHCFRLPKSPSPSPHFHLKSLFCEKIAIVGRRTLVGQTLLTNPDTFPFVDSSLRGPSAGRQTRSGGRTLTPPATLSGLGSLREALPEVDRILSAPRRREPEGDVADELDKDGDYHGPSVLPPRRVAKTLDDMFLFPLTAIPSIQTKVQTKDIDLSEPKVFRRSFPTTSHVEIELDAINCAPRAHGLPQMEAHVVLSHPFQAFESLSVKPCPDLISKQWYSERALTVEPRVELWLFSKDPGEPLTVCKTPRELARCFLDAICGHYHLFNKGFMHHDISFGNILKRKTVEIRDSSLDDNVAKVLRTLIKDQFSFFDSCLGFLHDTDLVVDWTDIEHQAASSKSGTPQFISRRLLRLWVEDAEFTHTVLDDLESMAWVGFWVTLHKDPSPANKALVAVLCDDNIASLYLAKEGIVNNLDKDLFDSPPIRQMRLLLLTWFKIADQPAPLAGLPGSMKSMEIYSEFMDAAVQFIESTDSDGVWGDVEARPAAEDVVKADERLVRAQRMLRETLAARVRRKGP